MSISSVRAGPAWAGPAWAEQPRAGQPTLPVAADQPTVPLRIPPARRDSRVVGVDAARGMALIGMMATHVFPVFGADGSPTAATVIAAGRAVSTFVLVAGVGVAFLSGGRGGKPAAAAGLVVRAVLIGLLGLVFGLLSPANGIDGILPFYGVFFLLAVPLLWLGPRALTAVTAVAFLLGPVALVATAGLPRATTDPTLATLVQDPAGLLLQLFVTGEYPAVVYLGYLAAGLAIGRLDLSSTRVGWALLGGGVVLAAGSRIVSWVLLYPLGGLAEVTAVAARGDVPAAEIAQRLLWEAYPLPTWWYLALPTPHSHSPVDLAHTLGCAMALLGALLLLTRVDAVRRLLSPLAAAGELSLTLYCAHLVVLASGILSDEPVVLLLAMVLGALAVAVAWRRTVGRGPLETLVSVPATAARRAVGGRRTGTTRTTRKADSPRPDRGRAMAVALAVVLLGLGFVLALDPDDASGAVAEDVETVTEADEQVEPPAVAPLPPRAPEQAEPPAVEPPAVEPPAAGPEPPGEADDEQQDEPEDPTS
ncbi:hypothetical protein GCM10023215_48830 [Pseudonocardia yuanmonensis]|uniref:Heparan-alpha-glucosaminide N-acetyltransferase catalytic domain-containing protein n=1 Tax=Pseudonocardia yuanmonensis TaxID=1095914 RepID=A0ABP8XCP1_9PSEU